MKTIETTIFVEPTPKGRPGSPMKATDQEIIDAYRITGSVWKSAEKLGMCGQSVWERLKKLGYIDDDAWTVQQIDLLKEYYSVGETEPININKLAELLGKHKTNVCRKAKELGLTTSRYRKKTPEYCQEVSRRAKEWLANNPHPKGAYKHGKEIRICPSCGMFFEVYPKSEQVYCSKGCGKNHAQSQGNQGYAKTGKRADLNNQYFRSRWEANYARYLNFLIANGEPIVKWEFEPETFEFKKIKKGTRFYTPDFKITFKDGHIAYHEVKGWDYPKGRTARKRFIKYYPHLELVLIDKQFFNGLRKNGFHKFIPYWEENND